MKKCIGCEIEKPYFQFSKNKNKPDGYQSYCKECLVKKNKDYYERNRDNRLKRGKEWKEKNKKWVKVYDSIYKDRIKYDFNRYLEHNDEKMKYRVNHEKTYKGLPLCSKKDFLELAKNSRELKILYKKWVKSGYQLYYRPTVDRIKREKGYLIDNIQFLPFNENSRKGVYERFGYF